MKMISVILAIVGISLPVCANEVSKQLESMPASERANALAGLLRQSGRDCGNSTRIFLQGYDREDSAYWNISCSNGRSYNILVQSNPLANTIIMECSAMKDIGIECFKKF